MLDTKDIEITTFRPSSHGNSTWLPAKGITVMHLPTSVGVTVDSERSQYANKERALQLLESLVIVIESQKAFEHALPRSENPQNDTYPYLHHWDGKVHMIKDVRQYAGCSLKEAKEAVDKMGTFEGALLHITGSTGYCSNGMDTCVCGGDLPSIREGCHNWKM